MLSPGRNLSCSLQDLDFGADYGTKGSYHSHSPSDYYSSNRRQGTMDTLSEEQPPAGGLMEKKRTKSRGRPTTLSDFLFKSSDKDYHSAPMTFFDEDSSETPEVSVNQNMNGGSRPSPLRQFGTMVGSLLGKHHKDGERKLTAKRPQRLDILDLGQKQQEDMAVKQDTIELLEWKVEQLQSVLSSPRAVHRSPAAVHPYPATGQPSPRSYTPSPLRNHNRQASITDFSEMQSTPGRAPQYAASPLRFQKRHSALTDFAELPETVCSKCQADEEEEKCPHEHFCSSPNRDPYLDAKLLEKAVFESAILHLFGMTAVKARVAVRFFCKSFMKQMEVSGYSVWRTLAEVDRSTKFAKKEHAAFALESRINKALYRSFENDSFDEVGITRIINPEKRCMIRLRDYQRLKLVEASDAVNSEHEDFDQDFSTFSESKLREIWFLFPWNLIFKDPHEKSSFNAAFLEAAKCVWQLHKLAFSVHPSVTILRVGKGMHANSKYVEQVTPVDEQCRRCEGPKIEFMTMPGFQTRKKIIKCQVYRHVQCV
ncbi:unnamed protein product [Calypogeia fissa]